MSDWGPVAALDHFPVVQATGTPKQAPHADQEVAHVALRRQDLLTHRIMPCTWIQAVLDNLERRSSAAG